LGGELLQRQVVLLRGLGQLFQQLRPFGLGAEEEAAGRRLLLAGRAQLLQRLACTNNGAIVISTSSPSTSRS